MNKHVTLSTPVIIPEEPELTLLKNILTACQAHWVKYFRGLLNNEPVGSRQIRLEWSDSPSRSHTREAAFALNRLALSGWLSHLHTDQNGIVVALPVRIALLGGHGNEPLPEAAEHPVVQAFHQLLEVHQQLIFACVAGEFGNSVESLSALRVGDDKDIPLALAQVLQDAGLAECYAAEAGREHYGATVDAAEGVAITLRVQDDTLADSLIALLKAS